MIHECCAYLAALALIEFIIIGVLALRVLASKPKG